MSRDRHFLGSTSDTSNGPRKRNARLINTIVISFILIIFLPLLLICGSVITFQTKQLNLPGTFIMDQDVGMMSLVSTTGLVDEIWNNDREIILVSPDEPEISYSFSPSELGLWVDPGATAFAAYQKGRDKHPFQEIALSLRGERSLVLPVLYFDSSTAKQALENIQPDLMIFPEEASLAYLDGAWTTLPSSSGRALDIDTILDYLMNNTFTTLLTQTAPLSFKTLSPATTDLSPVMDQIETVVAADLRFQAYDPITDEYFEWQVPIEFKHNWVIVDPASYEIQLEISKTDLASLIEQWEDSLGAERFFENTPNPKNIIDQWESGKVSFETIRHHATTYKVTQGESLWSISLKLGMPMWHILEANEGLTVNNLEAGMTLTIPSKNILLPLPVIPEKRIVIDLSDQVMYVYENQQLRNTYIVSTGMSDSPTMAGIFQIQNHYINAYASNWDLWMPHFMGIYEAWPDFMNGIHGLPVLSSGQRLWASALGSPASYGCIILDLEAAEDLYYWADEGVVVEIGQ